jgi:hypothetical protein
MPNPTHDEILAALPKKYRDMVDQSTAQGHDLDKAIIFALSAMAVMHPGLFKAMQRKLERKKVSK